MNERIKELVENSFIYDKQNDSSFFNKEKFAELIVEECEKVINGDIMYQANKGVITNIHGLNQARELIKHHFGVKE